MIPGTSAIGALAKIPVMSRKTRKVGQAGETAHAIVKMVNMANVPMVNRLRPKCSLMGAHKSGPVQELVDDGRFRRKAALLTHDITYSSVSILFIYHQGAPDQPMR